MIQKNNLRSLIPKHYTLRNRDSKKYVLLNWTIEVNFLREIIENTKFMKINKKKQ